MLKKKVFAYPPKNSIHSRASCTHIYNPKRILIPKYKLKNCCSPKEKLKPPASPWWHPIGLCRTSKPASQHACRFGGKNMPNQSVRSPPRHATTTTPACVYPSPGSEELLLPYPFKASFFTPCHAVSPWVPVFWRALKEVQRPSVCKDAPCFGVSFLFILFGWMPLSLSRSPLLLFISTLCYF